MRRAAVALVAVAAACGCGVAVTGSGKSRAVSDPASWRAYWTAVNPGSGIQFVSATTGVALAGQPVNTLDDQLNAPDDMTIVWPSPAVLVSRDGGRSWKRSLSTPAGFWGFAFADPLHGIAVGVTELYRTGDGGRHWQRIPEPGQPLVRVAYVMGPETVVGVTTHGQVVLSRNGGSSWSASAWKGRADAVCAEGGYVVVVAPNGGVWISKDPGFRFDRVSVGLRTRIQYGPWWSDLSCAGTNAVEFMLSACEAACGGGVQAIVRQNIFEGPRWRRVVEVNDGAASPRAPAPATAVAVGTRSACVFSYGERPTLEIDCTSNGGRSFTHARTPVMRRSRYPGVHLQGVSFVGRDRGWLLVDDTIVDRGRPPRYQTEVWATDDGGATWTVAYTSPVRRVPPLS